VIDAETPDQADRFGSRHEDASFVSAPKLRQYDVETDAGGPGDFSGCERR
jgi:hypothetical protein